MSGIHVVIHTHLSLIYPIGTSMCSSPHHAPFPAPKSHYVTALESKIARKGGKRTVIKSPRYRSPFTTHPLLICIQDGGEEWLGCGMGRRKRALEDIQVHGLVLYQSRRVCQTKVNQDLQYADDIPV